MNKLDCNCSKYLMLKEEYESYQNTAEKTIQSISERNIELERTLGALSSIVEISRYINMHLSDPNLIQIINDMMLGILGVTYSTMYLMEDDCLCVKVTNITQNSSFFKKGELIKENKSEAFVLNSPTPIYWENINGLDIHSIIGVPISLVDKLLGYIILEQSLYNFFNKEHVNFLSSIANQIAVVLENSFLYKKLIKSSEIDSLLDIYNRRYFLEKVQQIIRDNPLHSFSIVMVDLDDFKKVNDTFGHQFGDEVLKQTTRIIANDISSNDIIARYGGEELVILLYDGENVGEVYKKIDGIRQKISENIVSLGCYRTNITASFGVSFYPADSDKLEKMLNVADRRLYEAKRTGKNKVVVGRIK